MLAALWIPGKRRLTNGMLSDLRAAGVYVGRSRGKPKPGFDKFAAETDAIRMLVWQAARNAYPILHDPAAFLNVAVFVFGHRKHDPDAWYLLAKAAVDGLVSAKVIASDRHDVGMVRGRVLQTIAEESLCAMSNPVPGLPHPIGAGFIATLTDAVSL